MTTLPDIPERNINVPICHPTKFADLVISRSEIYVFMTSHKSSGDFLNGKKLVCQCGSYEFWSRSTQFTSGHEMPVQCRKCNALILLDGDFWSVFTERQILDNACWELAMHLKGSFGDRMAEPIQAMPKGCTDYDRGFRLILTLDESSKQLSVEIAKEVKKWAEEKGWDTFGYFDTDDVILMLIGLHRPGR